MLEPDELNEHEVAWLLSLASARRRKKEHATLTPRPGQTSVDFALACERQAAAVRWARGVEDHLIQILAELNPDLLRDHQEQRLRDLERA